MNLLPFRFHPVGIRLRTDSLIVENQCDETLFHSLVNVFISLSLLL